MCIMICDMMVGNLNVKRAMGGALVVVSALLASGCTQPKPVTDDVRVATSPEQARSAPTQPAVRPNDPEAEKPQKKAAAAAKQPEQAPATPVEPPVYSATELVGKSQTEVTALIGAPERVEQRAASTVWTYRKDECGLDVFFFLDMATSDERVLTVESTTEPAAASTAEASATATGTAATETTATDASAEATSSGVGSSDAAGGSVVDTCYGKLRRS